MSVYLTALECSASRDAHSPPLLDRIFYGGCFPFTIFESLSCEPGILADICCIKILNSMQMISKSQMTVTKNNHCSVRKGHDLCGLRSEERICRPCDESPSPPPPWMGRIWVGGAGDSSVEMAKQGQRVCFSAPLATVVYLTGSL